MGGQLRALVTGAAGFIGSRLVARLLDEGDDVVAVDSFVPYYDVAQKRANLEALRGRDGLEFHGLDLSTDDLSEVVDVDVVYHLAGQPGVRLSWSEGFAAYERDNVLATQRLLEAVRSSELHRFVFASSSSIYGNAATYPTTESDLPRPHSPYGVTKLAAEHLVGLYGGVHGLPVVSLRYFTVYGPGQRPDMLMHRLFEAALDGAAIPLFGDGSQSREFTFVDDVVDANLAATRAEVERGTVVNVAGGSEVTVAEVIAQVADLAGRPIDLDRRPPADGDVQRTGGAVDLAAELLGWRPTTDLATGLAAQLAWHEARR